MTQQEAFEKVFGKRPDFIQSHKTAIKAAMEIYAKAKWSEACDAMRISIIHSWDSDAPSEFHSVNEAPEPKFKS